MELEQSKLLVNDKITASCKNTLNMSDKPYIQRYKQQK